MVKGVKGFCLNVSSDITFEDMLYIRRCTFIYGSFVLKKLIARSWLFFKAAVPPEAVVRRCSSKEVSLKISQISKEIIFLKADSNTVVFM